MYVPLSPNELLCQISISSLATRLQAINAIKSIALQCIHDGSHTVSYY